MVSEKSNVKVELVICYENTKSNIYISYCTKVMTCYIKLAVAGLSLVRTHVYACCLYRSNGQNRSSICSIGRPSSFARNHNGYRNSEYGQSILIYTHKRRGREGARGLQPLPSWAEIRFTHAYFSKEQ